ncbi:MAG: hypothetical protein EOO23_08725, partial [Comamonadaceae bacterium]
MHLLRSVLRLVRCSLFALPLFLLGCLTDGQQVLGPERAVDVPGVMGAWSFIGEQGGNDLWILRTSVARYTVISLDKVTPDKSRVYEDTFLIPVPGQDDAFVASVVD